MCWVSYILMGIELVIIILLAWSRDNYSKKNKLIFRYDIWGMQFCYKRQHTASFTRRILYNSMSIKHCKRNSLTAPVFNQRRHCVDDSLGSAIDN